MSSNNLITGSSTTPVTLNGGDYPITSTQLSIDIESGSGNIILIPLSDFNYPAPVSIVINNAVGASYTLTVPNNPGAQSLISLDNQAQVASLPLGQNSYTVDYIEQINPMLVVYFVSISAVGQSVKAVNISESHNYTAAAVETVNTNVTFSGNGIRRNIIISGMLTLTMAPILPNTNLALQFNITASAVGTVLNTAPGNPIFLNNNTNIGTSYTFTNQGTYTIDDWLTGNSWSLKYWGTELHTVINSNGSNTPLIRYNNPTLESGDTVPVLINSSNINAKVHVNALGNFETTALPQVIVPSGYEDNYVTQQIGTEVEHFRGGTQAETSKTFGIGVKNIKIRPYQSILLEGNNSVDFPRIRTPDAICEFPTMLCVVPGTKYTVTTDSETGSTPSTLNFTNGLRQGTGTITFFTINPGESFTFEAKVGLNIEVAFWVIIASVISP